MSPLKAKFDLTPEKNPKAKPNGNKLPHSGILHENTYKLVERIEKTVVKTKMKARL